VLFSSRVWVRIMVMHAYLIFYSVTVSVEVGTGGATTMSCKNFSGFVGRTVQ